MLKGKNIVLGVTGGIAAYKSAELVRLLVKREAGVQVVMTHNAQEFVTPLTFQTLSGRKVVTDMFQLWEDAGVGHIMLADWADCLVVAPATANIIGKFASGIADDMLSTLFLAVTRPVIVCPAMNVNMYNNASVRRNMAKLRKCGINVVEPESGELACGWEGKGRLPEPETIVEEIEAVLSPKDLKGKRIMVTAGPTQEDIDPVRYITNRSSGKMGYAIARAARRRGADVVLVTGPVSLAAPAGIKVVNVRSANEMRKACLAEAEKADIVIKAAAVADFKPQSAAGQKIKKKQAKLLLEMKKNPDILAEIGKLKGQRVLVGFAAETRELIKNAKEKMRRKNLDIMVANDVTRPGAGFDHDTNIVTIIDRHGGKEELPRMTKEDVAEKILDRVRDINKKRKAAGKRKK